VDRIRELLESLSDAGVRSTFLDRLRARQRGATARGGLEGLQQEILGEMAASLGRAESKIDEALLRCELLGRELEKLESRRASGEAVERELSAALAAFEAERAQAERRLWELMVQREALGICRHEILQTQYPIPPRRKASG
jgi:DNA repair ATPase RecN